MKKILDAEAIRGILLSFIGDLTLADHMGDVSNAISGVLKKLGIDIEWDELNDLGLKLGKMGVKTLHGTDLYYPDDEEEADEE